VSDWFSDDKATFGDRLAGAREAAGLSQAELARRLGVTDKTIRAWEDDMSEPRANRLRMLAGMLNVSLIWLMTGEGEGVAAPEAREAAAPIPAEVEGVLTDLRLMRAEIERMAERVRGLERRLSRWSKDSAA